MEKCDKDFLETYIKSFAIISATKTVTITRVDTKEFVFMSRSMRTLLKQKSGEQEYKKLRDIYQIKPYINEYKGLFENIVKYRNPLSALIAHDFDNSGIRTVKLMYKELIISPITSKILAVIDELRDFTINREFAQFINLMNYTTGMYSDTKINEPISLDSVVRS